MNDPLPEGHMASHIRRRKFLVTLRSAAAWPLAARAQQGKLPTIGFLGTATLSTMSFRVAALVQRMRDLGWIDGRNVAIEYRWAEGRSERLAEIAAEFVRLKVDVIVTQGTPPTLATKKGNSDHPNRFRGDGGPGWQRPRREPCAARWQCHRFFNSDTR